MAAQPAVQEPAVSPPVAETVSSRQWVQEVVSRYKNDPTIAMWQLMNEAEIKTGDSSSSCASTADLYNFATDVSGMVKSIDPNHLVNLCLLYTSDAADDLTRVDL